MMSPQQKVAVLGAGPMGLAVAYQLSKEGYKPVVFEADDRLGGMAASFDFHGTSIERYYHFHCTTDTAFLELLDELGIAQQMRWVETHMGYYFKGQLYPWGNPIALLKFPHLSFIDKCRYGLHAFISTKRKNWKSLDKLEATTWIKRWIGENAYQVLWRKLFDYKFYEYANQLSAAWIWSRIRRIGRSRYNFFKEKLGYLEGGSETLLKKLQQAIENNGGEIHLKAPVSSVVIEHQKVKGIVIDGKTLLFDKVVSTIPLPYVAKIMSGLPKEVLSAYQQVKNIAVVCVIVKLRRPISQNFWLNINDPDMDIPGLVEYTQLRPLEHTIVYAPFYMPGEHEKFKESDEVFLNKVKNYLKKINPQLTEDDFIALHASRYRYAQPICQPQHLKGLPPVQSAVHCLWIADTSYYYPDDRGISESVAFGRGLARQVKQFDKSDS